MQDLQTTLRAYGAAWLEEDADKRLAHLEIAWADDGLYQDPASEATGRQALSDLIGGFHTSSPGARIELTGGADGHHDRIRFAWRMVDGDGNEQLRGIDCGRVDADGRLAEISGFFGANPPEND